jgi:hypothetical protein
VPQHLPWGWLTAIIAYRQVTCEGFADLFDLMQVQDDTPRPRLRHSLRRIICTTNAIESVNARIRRAVLGIQRLSQHVVGWSGRNEFMQAL